MQTQNPFLDEFAKITSAAMGLAQTASEEAKAAFRAQADRFVADFDLVRRDDVPRMPDWKNADILGVDIPALSLHAFDASVAVKVAKAMEIAHKPDLRV